MRSGGRASRDPGGCAGTEHRRPIARECRAAAEAEGFTSFELMATLPGVPLYARYGFREVERVTDRMPSGVALEFVR